VVGKSGAKLKKTVWDAAAPPPDGRPTIEKGELKSPGVVSTIFPGGPTMRVHTMAVAQPISKLAEMLSNQRGHPVVDKTGLTGKYDFTLEYGMGAAGLPPPTPGVPAQPAADAAGDPMPDLAAAIQNLGLTLVAGKAKLDVVVIDRINKVPTAN
jgi:uncharacterized protein (TIGR03435 family)